MTKSKPIKIIPDDIHPKMYRLQWPDGVKSQDFYNQTIATDILNNYDTYVNNMKKKPPKRIEVDDT